MTDRVGVVSPYGDVVSVPADQVDQAIERYNYTLATPEQLEKAKREEKYGGTLSQIGAATTGALSGATVGLSDVAIAGLVPGGREALQAYEELYPELRTGGELVGGIASAFVPAGAIGAAAKGAKAATEAGMLAKTARAVTYPMRAVSGMGVEIAERAAAQGIGRAGQLARAGLAEGAAIGLGSGLGHAAIDNKLSGEKLAISVAGGALTGGGIGLGLGKISQMLTRAKPTDAAIVAALEDGTGMAVGEAEKNAGRRWFAEEVVSRIAGVKPEDRAWFGQLAANKAEREIALDAGAKLEKNALEMVSVLNDVHRGHDDLLRKAQDALSPEAVAANVDRTQLPAQLNQLHGVLDEAQTVLDDLAPVLPKVDKAAERAAQEYQRTVNKQTHAETRTALSEALDASYASEDAVQQFLYHEGLKPEIVASNINRAQLPAQQAQFGALVNDVKRRLGAMIPQAGEASKIKELLALTEKAEIKIGTFRGDKSAEIYRVMDTELKPVFRRVGSRMAKSDNADTIYGFGQRLASGLEDAGVWGEGLAGFQKELNAPISRAIAAKEAYRKHWFQKKQQQHPIRRGEVMDLADPHKVGRQLKRAAVEGNLEEKALHNRLDSMLEHYAAVEKYGKLSPEVSATIAKAKSDASRALEIYDTTAAVARARTAPAAPAVALPVSTLTKGEQAAVDKLRQLIDKTRKNIDTIVDSPDASKVVYQVLDNELKQELRALSKHAKFSVVDDIANRLDDSISNQNVWGRAGVLRAEARAPSRLSPTSSPWLARKVESRFIKDWYAEQRIPHPIIDDETMPLADIDKILSNFNFLGKPGGSVKEITFSGTLKARLAYYEALEKLGSLNEAGLTALAKQKAATQKALAIFDDSASKSQLKFKLEALGEGDQGNLGRNLMAATPPFTRTGRIARRLIAPFSEPVSALKMITRIESMTQSFDGKLAGKVGKLFAEVQPIPPIYRAGAQITNLSTRELADKRNVALDFEATSARVRKLAEQSAGLRAELAQETDWFAKRVPTIQKTILETALRQIEYLSKHLPGSAHPPTVFSRPIPPPKTEQSKWLKRVRTVVDPTTVLDDLEKGTLTFEAVDAAKNVYPDLFSDMQQRVMDHVVELNTQNKRVPRQKRLQLGMLLGVPMDPTQQLEVVAAVQAAYAATQAAPLGVAGPRPIGATPDLAKTFRTRSEELAQK